MRIRRPQASDTPIKRCIALISDLHFGSIYALMHEYRTHDGRTIVPSFEQHQLNGVFKWCSEIMDYWKADTIIFVGDILQGSNVKSLGRDTVFTDLEEQQDLAIQYLTPICKKRKIFGVSGTTYHKSIDTEIEKDVIEGLNGKFLEKMAWIKVEGTKRILNVAHESAKSKIYPVSACEREATQLFKAYGEGKLPYRPDVIIRGHRHIFSHIHTTAYHFVVVPSFQVWYPFQTAYYGALQSDVGIALLFIDKKDRVLVHHYTTKLNVRIGDKTYNV